MGTAEHIAQFFCDKTVAAKQPGDKQKLNQTKDLDALIKEVILFPVTCKIRSQTRGIIHTIKSNPLAP